MMGQHKQQITLNLLADFLEGFIFHIILILSIHCINDDLLWQLHSQSIFIDGNSLNIVTTTNFDSCFGYQVLNDNISHQLSISVTLLIKTMNRHELYFEHLDLSSVVGSKDRFILWSSSNSPTPVTHFPNSSNQNSFFVPQSDFLIRPRDSHKFSRREE